MAFQKEYSGCCSEKIIEELSSGSRELHPAWKGLSCLPAVSLLLISISLPLAAQATSFVHVVHVPVLLFAGCTAVTQFCVFAPLDSELLNGRSCVQGILVALCCLAIVSTLSTPLLSEKMKWLR